MKKLLLLFASMLAITAMAQDDGIDSVYQIVKEKGVYEKIRVVAVDNVNAATLYVRAMEALSDWTGPDGLSKAGLDFCDKDAGIVNYKGDFYNGSQKFPGGKVNIYTDFALKVRCKDGRAQITVTVPSIHYVTPQGRSVSTSIKDVVEQRMKMSERDLEKANKKTENKMTIQEIVDTLLDAMSTALNKAEEDF